MMKETRKLSLVTDMYGCPNRCMHCWLGHMPNRKMEEKADEFIVSLFKPHFDQIAYYSWLREPDFCDDYEERWEKDIAVSKNCRPMRFELASFWRIVRDPDYIPFLKKVGTRKVQLTFFGTEETQDRYIGRKGAFEEAMKASYLLAENGIVPRWQCFINEENKDEIVSLHETSEKFCEEMNVDNEFFVHEGTCDGENRKLYPIRIRKQDIPEELKPFYRDPDELKTEEECVSILKNDETHPSFHNKDEIVLNISNVYDVYFNFTHMKKEWIIGNLKEDDFDEVLRRIVEEDIDALRKAKKVTYSRLVQSYGDAASQRAFRLDDYKLYLFNEYLERNKNVS